MKATISYQTMHLPPPFAYAFTVQVDLGEKEPTLEFEMEYLNRDTLSEEDILNEGYSLNDDFKWSGTLPAVWNNLLKSEFKAAELHPETADLPVWIHLDIKEDGKGLIADIDRWEYLLQELIQAIYEKAGIENPLKVIFMEISEEKRTQYVLNGSFATRTCVVNGHSMSWEKMQELLSIVFSMDFEGDFTDLPEKPGLWINPDGLSGFQSVESMRTKGHETVTDNILTLLKPYR